MKKSLIKNILITLSATAVIFIVVTAVLAVSNNNSENTHISEATPENVPAAATTSKPDVKDFVALNKILGSCDITKYFTYGTSLCIDGSLTYNMAADIKDMTMVLKQSYTEPDGSVISDDLYEFDIFYKVSSNNITFSSYEKINKGISLENLKDGEYCLLLKVSFNDGTQGYFTLNNSSAENALCYYTMTKNNTNQKIDISFGSFSGNSYMYFNVAQAPLPADVYDIVIDPGHGGNDSGAVNKNFYEADITLDYSIDLKKALEAAGFKVKLTRDGTEAKDTPMAYTMYDEDGRVNVACASKAKYCLSIHLNSNAEYVSRGGVQVYVSYRADESFGKTLAGNIADSSGAILSNMKAFKLSDGVYTRAFSSADIKESRADAIAGGYAPYDNLTTDTDYYYMIRELGGIATNAYADGRKKPYGVNLYKDSNHGIESYIIELGFISIDEDLEHILNNKDKYIEGIVKSFTEK